MLKKFGFLKSSKKLQMVPFAFHFFFYRFYRKNHKKNSFRFEIIQIESQFDLGRKKLIKL